MLAWPCLVVSTTLVLAGCGDDGAVSPEPDAGADAGPICEATAADFPAPVSGQCSVEIVDPTATLVAGDDGAGGVILPTGRRVTRAGRTVVLPGFPLRVAEVPGTRFAVVTDGFIGDEALRVVDLDSMTVVDEQIYRRRAPAPEALFWGLAASNDPGGTGRRVWASGGGAGIVWALDVDPATGALTSVPEDDLALAASAEDGYVVGIALTPDGGTLVAALMLAGEVVAIDLATGAERRVVLDMDPLPYDVVISPDGATAFVSTWGGSSVVPIALATMTAGAPIPVGKNPEGLALSPDGTRLIAAASDSDSLAVIDVATRTVTDTVWIAAESAPRGSAPVSVAFDSRGRLYAANSGDASIDVFAPSMSGGPSYTRIGRIPTTWYPTDVRIFSGDRVAVVTGKHDGKGPNTTPETLDIDDLGRGSLSIFEPADLGDTQLATWSAEVTANNERGARMLDVVCPDGAPYDFPIPEPGGGPSTAIDHVVLVVRENKTYDSYFGALAGGRGDPALTIVAAAEMDQVVPNTLALASAFTALDNYYSASDRSIQGHIWTVFGRTTDFVERTQGTTSGRGYWPIPPQGVSDPGVAEEGNAFDWMIRHGIDADNFGEIVAARSVSLSPRYPGLVYNMDVSDVARADFLRREWATRCRMKTFSYVLMPNDHTYGLDPGRPTPRAMMADNDAGVGRLVEAVSHSTYWPRTAIFVVEDDPQTGGDHIDNHRAPALVISPWARRGHVSGVIANEASVYRTIQLILGIDEPLNAYWANAAPLYDAFTATPDYTPYEMIPRRWPEETNPDDGSSAAALSASFDWSDPDEQPGLGRLVFRHLRPDRLPAHAR